MSIVSCCECGYLVDSDKHPECFQGDKPYCAHCMPEEYEGVDYTKQVNAMLNAPPDDEDEP